MATITVELGTIEPSSESNVNFLKGQKVKYSQNDGVYIIRTSKVCETRMPFSQATRHTMMEWDQGRGSSTLNKSGEGSAQV